MLLFAIFMCNFICIQAFNISWMWEYLQVCKCCNIALAPCPICPKAHPVPEHRARAPLFDNFYGCIFENFDSKTRINFIVSSMQCLQNLFYSLLSLQKHRVCVKGHQNNHQTSNFIPRRDRVKFAGISCLFFVRYSYACFAFLFHAKTSHEIRMNFLQIHASKFSL